LAGGDGTAASVQRKIQSPNNVTERRGGGVVVDEGVGRRRASAPAWSESTAAHVLCSQCGGRAQEIEEQRKKTMVWGKKEKFTPAALFIYRQVRVVGVVVSVPLPRPFLREDATWRHGVGRRFL
jgi:hypothetical protein